MRAVSVIACLLFAGCGAPPTKVDLSDSGVFAPSARVAIDIGANKAERPADPHDGAALELGVSGGRASGEQTLGAGQAPINFAGQTFNAPQQLKGDFDFRFFEALLRYRTFPRGGSFGVEGLIGFGYANADLRLASATQSKAANLDSGGFILGGGLLWRLRPSTSLQARFTAYGSAKGDKVSQASHVELSLAHAITRNVGLRAGYSYWDFSSDRSADLSDPFPNGSEFRMHFSGPTLGLEVMF